MSAEAAEPHALPAPLERWLIEKRSDAAWKARAAGLLLELLDVDTTPKAAPQDAARAEAAVFALLERELGVLSALRIRRAPIRPEIAGHPYFTIPYYAGGLVGSPAETVARVYGGRANLTARLPAPGAARILLNAHIDTVAPHIPPRRDGDIVHGRGAVDDKGPCLAIVLAMQLLAEAADRFGARPACETVLQFVIDEEPGGNGSLSAALDEKAAPPDAAVVGECTGLAAYPANRGAVWYALRLRRPEGSGPLPRDALLEAAAFAVGAMEQCGRRLRAESDHPLFPHRPVQTCHGRLGEFGRHPSRVHDYVAMRLAWQGPAYADVRAVVDAAVAEYCREYGDKTQPGVGDGVLKQHTRWSDVGDDGGVLEVFGLAGHMGAVVRLDGAITKAAAVIRALVRERRRRREAWQSLRIGLTEGGGADPLILEGGQGFLPTHTLEDVCERLRQAVGHGVGEYLTGEGLPAGAVEASVTFDKLHNAAFARRTDGPALAALLAAASATGIYRGEPVRGWDVSCDARIFANEFPDAEIITFGPGLLARAHANDEQIDINDVLIAAETLARLVWTVRRQENPTRLWQSEWA